MLWFGRMVIILIIQIPLALQFLERYTKKGKTFVDGTHIYAGLKMKDIPKDTRCFVDLWQWREDTEPKQIQI